jgi:glutaredoxin 3
MPELTLYTLHGCPYCAAVRDRLGELGLEYHYIEVPPRRAERNRVREVSGQESVPVLVIRESGTETVLSDENDILAFLDERYGVRSKNGEAAPWDETATAMLKSVVEGGQERIKALYELADRAAAAGDRDRENVLRAAAWYLRDAQRWASGQLED